MGVFWSLGYNGTSLPDLLEATQLSRGSLYAAFGDKHGLFLRSLDRYIDESVARLDREVDPRRDAVVGLRTCLAGYVERASHDSEVERRIRRFLKAMESRLAAP